METSQSFDEVFDELLIGYKFATNLLYFSENDFGHIFKTIHDEFVKEIDELKSIEQP